MAGRGDRRSSRLFASLWGAREYYLAIALLLWLGGYFVLAGGEQRKAFLWLLPVLVLNGDLLAKTVRETRWLWAVAALLGWQSLSRLWAGSAGELVGTGFDALVVFVVLTGLVRIGRQEGAGSVVIACLSVLAAVVAAVSLVEFYGSREHSFGGDRLRNVLISENGLNAVLTGMLCGFGGIGMAWATRRDEWRLRRNFCLGLLAVLTFALMAAQSRGAMLAFGAGLAVLLWYARLRLWPALTTVVAAVLVYLVVVWIFAGAPIDLGSRGATGRFDIYRWFLSQMDFSEVWVGKGMGTPPVIPEDQLGWLVYHPHSAYLTQFLLTGVLGLGFLFLVLGGSILAAWKEARGGMPLWFALLASGMAALAFDCAQIFSVYSQPRIELLLVAVPGALLMGSRARDR